VESNILLSALPGSFFKAALISKAQEPDMEARRLFLEPAIIVVDNDPDCIVYINDIVLSVLGVNVTIFKDKNHALEWCAVNPVHVDLVIIREGDIHFNGFKLLKELDGIFLRPVFAVFLLNPSGNEASAECWFYQLDKVFKTIIPFKAIRYPYRLSKLGSALNDAFSWYKADMHFNKITGKNAE
jgi:hypothetical protein